MYPTGAGTPEIRGYRGLTRVGRGGFSFVYKAEQVSLGRDVAIKILLTDLADEAEVRRFTNECRILGQLGAHPNIVNVHDAGLTDDGRPFIVMKFYGHGSLADQLRTSGPLEAKDVISIGVKLATALQAAHAIGVIHRDVKPDNVLIDDNGEPILTDFGVAAVADASGRFTSSIAFSHAHVAPEVLDGNAFGPKSDVYSLGSTLYTLLTGRAAFEADTEIRQILAIMQNPVPPIDMPRIPARLTDAIMRAMNKDRDARFPDAASMAAALEAITYQSPAGTLVPANEATVIRIVQAPAARVQPAFDAEATRIRPASRPPTSNPMPGDAASATQSHPDEVSATPVAPERVTPHAVAAPAGAQTPDTSAGDAVPRDLDTTRIRPARQREASDWPAPNPAQRIPDPITQPTIARPAIPAAPAHATATRVPLPTDETPAAEPVKVAPASTAAAPRSPELSDSLVGSVGPGGGIVFHDAGAQKPWGRYLEVAPAGWSGTLQDPLSVWRGKRGEIATDRAVGTGEPNTAALARLAPESAAAIALTCTSGGVSDWFLPSLDVLELLYQAREVAGGLSTDLYWSSTGAGRNTAWFQAFADGFQGCFARTDQARVRPIRAF